MSPHISISVTSKHCEDVSVNTVCEKFSKVIQHAIFLQLDDSLMNRDMEMLEIAWMKFMTKNIANTLHLV